MTHTNTQSPARYTLLLGNRGRLVLPSDVRQRLDLKDGDRLILTVEADGTLLLASTREAARAGRGLLRQLWPDFQVRNLSEELIVERRGEAASE